MTDWVNGRYIYRYDMATDNYSGKLHLRPVPQWQQGIAAFGARSTSPPTTAMQRIGEVEISGSAASRPAAPDAYVTHEKAFTEFRAGGRDRGH